MRMVIPLCRHCSRNPETCEHRAALRGAVRNNGSNATVIHNCTVYPTLWSPGDKVWVTMKEYTAKYYPGRCDANPEPPYWDGEWRDAPAQQGTIESASRRFYTVKFDPPITVSRPEGGNETSWEKAVDIAIDHISVYANRLHREKPEFGVAK